MYRILANYGLVIFAFVTFSLLIFFVANYDSLPTLQDVLCEKSGNNISRS